MGARAFVAIGSNLDDPPLQVHRALRALAALPRTRLAGVSPFYRSAPVGPPQPDYLNGVAELDTELEPLDLLDALQALERHQGRVRQMRWGPRTLDLDLLLYDHRLMEHPRLVLPHPRLQHRPFVLYPLFDLAPELVVPGYGPLKELLGPFQ
ncbi:MAG: 2-amino-4-hydroxy-6-hydroxymethyldihydropteridine diphosphokinase, partial [Candidatus Competibacteraceae bacterium]|nr:2-amino-4-hydroxy-6-hydroxymethyldihydropteridine diphosphokinase [Candidatus Competibacteraceae bacterium]